MTAGKGIVHAEMPASFDEPAVGFQLWLNLDKDNKLRPPRYQELKRDSIPVYKDDGKLIKVISGEILGLKGPIEAITPTYFLDVTLFNNSEFMLTVPQGWNSMIIAYRGELEV